MRRAEGRTVQAIVEFFNIMPETNCSRVQIILLKGNFWKPVVFSIIFDFEYFNKNTTKEGIKCIEHLGCCMLSGCIQQCLVPLFVLFCCPTIHCTYQSVRSTACLLCSTSVTGAIVTMIYNHHHPSASIKAFYTWVSFICKSEFQSKYILCQQRRRKRLSC